MGIDGAGITFLSGAKRRGVDFTRTLTLGRQEFFPRPGELQHVFTHMGVPENPETFLRANRFADRFFTLRGVHELVSRDYSEYEGATIIHDLNQPLPAKWRETASVVFDGGTLEHVFNVPEALRTCMELVALGGHFIQITMANNFLGHGFWQFSPELVFRTFAPENGFESPVVLLHEAIAGGAWYFVSDPVEVRSRVELCNCHPTYMLTIAKRNARAKIFSRPPLQSDYEAAWTGTSDFAPLFTPDRGYRRLVPESIVRAVKPLLRDWSLFGLGWNQPYFSRLDATAVAQGRFM